MIIPFGIYERRVRQLGSHKAHCVVGTWPGSVMIPHCYTLYATFPPVQISGSRVVLNGWSLLSSIPVGIYERRIRNLECVVETMIER